MAARVAASRREAEACARQALDMNGELPRVPLVRKMTWIGDDDAAVSIAPPIGRRISMDISEEALAQMGARVIEAAIEQLGTTVPHLYASEIQQAVDALLLDRAWLQPIIEHEVRRATRAMVMALWSDEEKAAQREWFDLFVAKYR